MSPLDRARCAALDAADPLAGLREDFALPQGVIYLDGNSLGALPKATPARLAAVIEQEWGEDLITSWNKHGWIELPRRIGDKIARLIGAGPGEVVVADSTSVNLFKVLAAALTLNLGRSVILSERENFPTDLYIAQGLIGLLGGRHRLRLVEGEAIAEAIDAETAVVMLTHVNYRSGAMHDMAAITGAAQAQGALMLWDLAHSAGAVPVDLTAAQADFAVGCGYKYLNGGPGAPAFVWVPPRHQERFAQPLSGWLGHAEPFAFLPDYRPAPGIGRYVSGTPALLSLAALEMGVDLLLTAQPSALREKSLGLTEIFIAAVEQQSSGLGLALLSPRQAERRGSQVSFRHAQGWPVMQALIARGITGAWDRPEFHRRAVVT
jgi:kynureninase